MIELSKYALDTLRPRAGVELKMWAGRREVLSRRDLMKVARHGMPWYPHRKRNRPVGHGMTGSDTGAVIRTMNRLLVTIHTVRLRDGVLLMAFSRTECLRGWLPSFNPSGMGPTGPFGAKFLMSSTRCSISRTPRSYRRKHPGGWRDPCRSVVLLLKTKQPITDNYE